MIVYVTATCNSRIDQTKECINRINQYNKFDRKVIIVNESPDDILMMDNKNWLYDNGCEVYKREWNDDMPAMRNAYLEKCQVGDWIVVSDSDEWFCEEFCKDIDEITRIAEDKGLNLLLINSRDVTTWEDGKTTKTTSDFFKNLIFKKDETTRYEGVGQEKKVHETLILKKANMAKLDVKYYYEHIKEWHEIWERATRNVFIGGGGNNVGDLNEEWVKLREITKKLGIHNWPEFKDVLINNISKEDLIDSFEPKITKLKNKLLSWILRNRRMGYDWENEMCDVFRWFRYLHPDLVPNEMDVITEEIPERAKIMAEVERAYIDILGRNADTPGKMLYTRLIEQGRTDIEGVKHKLSQSEEKKLKEQDPKVEVIKTEKIKVDVSIHLTDENIKDVIINKSKIFREKYLKPLHLGLKWEALLSITKKEESDGKGDDITSEEELKPYIDLFKQHIPPAKYNMVLDIGAGAGIETKMIGEDYNVLGITFGRDNIEYAAEQFSIGLIEMDMHNLEYPSGFFDAIFSLQTFEHAFSPWLHILEMRRVLRDDGRIFLDVPAAADYVMQETIWHVSVLYPDQIRALFIKAGFKEIIDLSTKHRQTFIFEKIPDGEFPMWDYIQHIMLRLNRV